MPIKNGWETLPDIHKAGAIPVILLTARSDELNILRGFSQDADGYVTKLFSFAQLEARVQAVLAHGNRTGDNKQEVLQHGGTSVALNTHQVFRSGEIVRLSPTEFILLVALINEGRIT